MSVDTRPDPPTVARRPLIIMAVVMSYDLGAAALAMFAAIRIRFEVAPVAVEPPGLAAAATLLFVACCAVVFPALKLHRGVWRFTAFNDVLAILRAVALANLVFFLALFLINRQEGFPRSTLVIEAPLLFGLLVGARFLRQISANGDWRSLVRLEDRSKPSAILVGSNAALDTFLRAAKRRPHGPPFRVRGLAAPNGAERGRSIHGVPVLGGVTEAHRALISLAEQDAQSPQLVIVDPALSVGQVQIFSQAAAESGAQLVRARHEVSATRLSPLNAADLMSRPPRPIDADLIRALVKGRRIWVTGAGGTIGSEITRQVVEAEPAAVTLLDVSEYNLYELEMELKENGRMDGVTMLLGDVRDRERVETVAREARADVVLHAAALKHVPLMERNPAEAVLTNVLGTVNVAEAAKAAGAVSFVLISTDKAVNPSNVMGASKRAAEMFVQAMDLEGGMRATAVRFGNVLGSSGSVVPLFERQIAQGGPITVTHPEITRYFMTSEEAGALVLQAAALTSKEKVNGVDRRGGLYTLDMGEPVRIETLARELCRLRGRVPDRDVKIVHIGLRPGEKVHEQLFYSEEEITATSVDGIWWAKTDVSALATLQPKIEALLDAARRRDRPTLYDCLHALTDKFDGGQEARPV